MPRSYVAADRTLLAGAYNVYTRVEVRDSDGTWRDLTNYGGTRNFLVEARWSRQLDQPVMTGSVTFLRSVLGYSLSPTVTASPMNLDAASAYHPLLNNGASIRISTACTALGVGPVAGDWREVFFGRIDDPEWGGDDGTITVTISDLGAWLLDQNIETERQYAASTGTPVETVMQSILTDNPTVMIGAPTLYVPVSPGWNIKTFTQQQTNVLEALRALAQQIGWDVRFMYDAANVYRLTFFLPARTKTVADYTLSTAEYYAIPALSQNLGDVRTRIVGSYVDATTKARVPRAVQSDLAHTNQYGVRTMIINEDASSNIDSATEMDKMLNAALSDLQDPAATQRVESSYFWLAELGDLIGWPANSVHYDTTQNLAVVGVEHVLNAQGEVTVFTCRGKVAGSFKEWLAKVGGGTKDGNPAAPPIPQISVSSQTKLQAVLSLAAIDNAHTLALQWQTRVTVGGVPGAWSALSTTPLPTTLTVVRDPFWPTLVELQVFQGDGQSAIAPLTVAPRNDGLDVTTGKVDRAVPMAGGGYAAAATDTNGYTLDPNATDSTLRTQSVRRTFAKPSYTDSDDADHLPDGPSRRVPLLAHLDAGGTLRSAVGPDAQIADQYASSVAKRAGSSYFAEAFDTNPATNGWTAGGVIATAAASGSTSMGKKLAWWNGGYGTLNLARLLPFNPNKLYRIRARLLTQTANTTGSSLWYVGLVQYNSSGAVIANSNAGVAYVGAAGANPAVASWQEYVGWFRGASLALTSYPNAPSTDPTAPTALNIGCAQVAPLVYAGYSGSGGQFFMDYLLIDEFDEDGSVRTYSAIDSYNGSYGRTLPTTRDSTLREVRRSVAKTTYTDPDSLDGVPEGASYNRILATAVTSGQPDLGKAGVIGKYGTNISRSSGDATLVATIVQNLQNSGHLASAMQDSTARPVNRAFAKANSTDGDSLDYVPEGTTYKRVAGVNGSNLITPSSSAGRNRVKAQGSMNVAASTFTNFNFSTAPYQSGASWSSGSPSKLTVPASGPVGGLWMLTANVSFPGTVGSTGVFNGIVRMVRLIKNGATVLEYLQVPPVPDDANGWATMVNLTTLIDSPANGDYYEVVVYHDMSTTQSVTASLALTHLW